MAGISESICPSASHKEQHVGQHSITPTRTEQAGRKPRFLPKIPSSPGAEDREYENLAGFLGENKPSEEVYELKSAVMQEIRNMDVKALAKLISDVKPLNDCGEVLTDHNKINRETKKCEKSKTTFVTQTIIITGKEESELNCSKGDLGALNSGGPPKEAAYLSTCQLNQQRCLSQWDKASSVPLNIEEFSLDEVSLCFNLLGLGKHADEVKHKLIDGALLASLDQEMLLSEIGLSRLEARKLDLFVHKKWRPKE